MKKLHNIMLASILCVGMHSALAETGETSTVVDTGGGATQELDATDATLQALVEQIALLSVKERKDLFQKVREMLNNSHESERKGASKDKRGHVLKKVGSKHDCNKREGNKEDIPWAFLKDQKVQKYILHLFDQYHSKQHDALPH